MEEGKCKKVSPSIAKKLIFFEGKCNTQGIKLGTAQYTAVRCTDLAGQSSNSTARRQQGDRKMKGMETWKSESVRVDECRHEKRGDLGNPGSQFFFKIVENLNNNINNFCRTALKQHSSDK